MITVPQTDFVREIAKYQDEVQRGPIKVTHYGRERYAVISMRDLALFEQLLKRARVATQAADMDDDLAAAIAGSEMPAGYEHLNEELRR